MGEATGEWWLWHAGAGARERGLRVRVRVTLTLWHRVFIGGLVEPQRQGHTGPPGSCL
jgi:hypothetical protein